MVAKYAWFSGVALLVVLFDQVTKALVLLHMPLYKSVVIVPGLFNLTHVRNPGGAFGFMAGNEFPLRHWFFLIAALSALVMIVYFYHHTPPGKRLFGSALALIFGGAVGNLIDRLRFGEVVDFLDLHLGAYHWPTFNVADSAVTVGVIIFLLHILFRKMPI